MPQEVIAIFDIGKNSKKFFLFSSMLKPVYQTEETFKEIQDDDEFACDDISSIQVWMRQCLAKTTGEGVYSIKAVNFTTCGASLNYLNHLGNGLVPDSLIEGRTIVTGIGLYHISASLVPYLIGSAEPFVLIATGARSLFMNPFNPEPLTPEQLQKGALFYTGIHQELVKSSYLCTGPVHDVNVEKLNRHFGVTSEHVKTVKTNSQKIDRLMKNYKGRMFFRNGVPSDYADNTADLSHFLTYADAYHQLMADLVDLCMGSLALIIPQNDQIKTIYISGDYSKNELFTRLLAARLPKKKVFTSAIDNAAALGAAIVVWDSAFGGELPFSGLGLKAVLPVL